MKTINKFALWSFGILLLNRLRSIGTIIEFGNWDNYYNLLLKFPIYLQAIVFSLEVFYFSINIFLYFIYPIVILINHKKNDRTKNENRIYENTIA